MASPTTVMGNFKSHQLGLLSDYVSLTPPIIRYCLILIYYRRCWRVWNFDSTTSFGNVYILATHTIGWCNRCLHNTLGLYRAFRKLVARGNQDYDGAVIFLK